MCVLFASPILWVCLVWRAATKKHSKKLHRNEQQHSKKLTAVPYTANKSLSDGATNVRSHPSCNSLFSVMRSTTAFRFGDFYLLDLSPLSSSLAVPLLLFFTVVVVHLDLSWLFASFPFDGGYNNGSERPQQPLIRAVVLR